MTNTNALQTSSFSPRVQQREQLPPVFEWDVANGTPAQDNSGCKPGQVRGDARQGGSIMVAGLQRRQASSGCCKQLLHGA